jgi:hypothetical protein
LKSTDVQVVEFHPEVDVDDAEFTLEGLHLPSGTEVIDKLADVTYRVDAGSEIDMLEKPLAEAEFTQKIQDRVDNRDANARRQTSAAPDTAEIETPAKAPSGGRAGVVVLVGLIAVTVVGLALLLSHRWSLSRKVRRDGQ